MSPAIRNFFLLMKDELETPVFVEGGTFRGETSLWAADHYKTVITIEASDSIYQANQTKNWPKHIHQHLGETQQVLQSVLEKEQPYAFWLDAHWSLGETYEGELHSPILEEIKIINERCPNSLLVIDDARHFILPPPPPIHIEKYPDISQIILALQAGEPRYVILFEDCIIGMPIHYKGKISTILDQAKDLSPEQREALRQQQQAHRRSQRKAAITRKIPFKARYYYGRILGRGSQG